MDRYNSSTLRSGWRRTARALSCSLPKRREPFRRLLSRPFFESLLPEGAQRDAVARVLAVSPDNEFGLLERLGGDVAGAFSLWREGESPSLHESQGSRRTLEKTAD